MTSTFKNLSFNVILHLKKQQTFVYCNWNHECEPLNPITTVLMWNIIPLAVLHGVPSCSYRHFPDIMCSLPAPLHLVPQCWVWHMRFRNGWIWDKVIFNIIFRMNWTWSVVECRHWRFWPFHCSSWYLVTYRMP